MKINAEDVKEGILTGDISELDVVIFCEENDIKAMDLGHNMQLNYRSDAQYAWISHYNEDDDEEMWEVGLGLFWAIVVNAGMLED